MFVSCQVSPQRPAPFSSPTASRKISTLCSIRKLDMNSTLEVMSFLNHKDLMNLGAVSREYASLTRHPSLWRDIKINKMKELSVPDLVRLMSLTTDKMPLNSIVLSGPVTTGCYCRESTVCESCSSLARCTSDSTCVVCESLAALKPKMGKLTSLTVQNVKFQSCPFNTMLRTCNNLKKLDILNDLDVNLVISGLAANCPLLTDIRFKYSHYLEFDASFRQSHPLLRQQVAERFVSACPGVKHISFCHYTIDEDCARCLLQLKHVIDADFSDNENLSGAFLVALPTKWVKLRKLVMRDCTELDNDYVQTFASMLLQNYGGILKYCQKLAVADFSCQWAFHDDSLIGDGIRAALSSVRASFRWREDQCEVPGFGIDPESGIDGIEDEDGLIDFTVDDAPEFSESDMSNATAVLVEALAHHHRNIHSSTSATQPQQQAV